MKSACPVVVKVTSEVTTADSARGGDGGEGSGDSGRGGGGGDGSGDIGLGGGGGEGSGDS